MFSILLLVLIAVVGALPQAPAPIDVPDADKTHGCRHPRIRKEWRGLTSDEKTSYLDAVECLFNKPAKGKKVYPKAESRYDDFVLLHIEKTTAPDPRGRDFPGANRGLIGPGIHFNGVFLPWHRYTVWTYENALRDECGYKGAHPYWDYSLDMPDHGSSFDKSPIFDPVYGFGGNGIDGTGPAPVPGLPRNSTDTSSCIFDGRFAKYMRPVGPGYNQTEWEPHCIKRNLQPDYAASVGSWAPNTIPLLEMTSFQNFSLGFDRNVGTGPGASGVHSAGHSGVNGEMRNLWSSMNDPLFFMHHANIDRLWALWQSLKPQYGNDFGGYIWPNGTGIMTVDYPVEMFPWIAPDVPIRKILDTQNKDGRGVLCYKYEEDGQPLP